MSLISASRWPVKMPMSFFGTPDHKPKILEVPVPPALKAELDAERLDLGPICRSSEGKPWTANGFRSSWQKAAKAAGVHGKVTFRN